MKVIPIHELAAPIHGAATTHIPGAGEAFFDRHVTAAALMREGEGVRAGGIGRGQTPDLVAALVRIKFLVLAGAIGVEVEVQRIAGQRQGVVQVNVRLSTSSTSEA